MAQSIEESLLKAVIKDDIKAFSALTESARCGSCRLGRFPVLSLMYLYKSRRLISAYEEKLLKITAWEALREPSGISDKFAGKAGKCLRLYFDEVVSPLEMLLILNKTRRLKRVYPLTKPSAAVKERLQKIYAIRYSLNIKFKGDSIILDRRPLSYGEKKKIATACLCSFLAVAVAVGTPVTAVALMPKLEEGEVTKLSHIDFNSKNEYTLKKDITVPEDFSIERFNCKISGGGKKLILGRGASFGDLNGSVKDVLIVSGGAPLFTSVTENGKIENVTVNVTADVETTGNTAFLAVTNYGSIDGVTVNVSGKFSAVSENEAELYFGGVVCNNSYKNLSFTKTAYGTVENCTVNYGGFTLSGETKANASFGGVAGLNSGYVKNCSVTGSVIADTVDVAGVCCVNNGVLSENVNCADIAQTSGAEGWSPIVCGIVLNNSYTAEYCQSTGKLSATSSYVSENSPSASVAGIAYLNSGSIVCCKVSGDIAVGCGGIGYAGGIAARTCEVIYGSYYSGSISVAAKSAFAGGILASGEVASNGYSVYCGAAQDCISESVISVSATDKSCAGGIAGFIQEGGFEQYKTDENGNIIRDENGKPATETIYLGGGATNSYFLGKCATDVEYFGNIVGVCGANIYESNSYTSGNTEYHNFEGNYFTGSDYPVCGAVVVGEGEFASAEDKGATQATAEEIKALQSYTKILQELENKNP